MVVWKLGEKNKFFKLPTRVIFIYKIHSIKESKVSLRFMHIVYYTVSLNVFSHQRTNERKDRTRSLNVTSHQKTNKKGKQEKHEGYFSLQKNNVIRNMKGTVAWDGFVSGSITSQKEIKDLKYFWSGSNTCRVINEFVHLSAYALWA